MHHFCGTKLVGAAAIENWEERLVSGCLDSAHKGCAINRVCAAGTPAVTAPSAIAGK